MAWRYSIYCKLVSSGHFFETAPQSDFGLFFLGRHFSILLGEIVSDPKGKDGEEADHKRLKVHGIRQTRLLYELLGRTAAAPVFTVGIFISNSMVASRYIFRMVRNFNPLLLARF